MAQKTIDLELSRNERLALDAIRRLGSVTRGDMSEILDVTRAHATNITRTLHQKNLIEEDAVLAGQKGQPTRIIRLNADSNYAFGATFTEKAMEVGVIDWLGNLKGRDTLAIRHASIDAIARSLRDYMEKETQRLRLARKKVLGIGLAVPGDFVKDRREINAVYFPEFRGVDLAKAFAERLEQPVHVENDGSSAAWGESFVGAGRRLSSCLFIHIGHGLGGGIVIKGRLFRGFHGNAGAFGAPFPQLAKPRPSGADLIRSLQQAGWRGKDFIELKSLDAKFEPALTKWIHRAGGQLADALTTLTRAFDPEAVIIGGRLPLPIVERLIARIVSVPFCAHDHDTLPVPPLLPSALGDTGGVIGAAALSFEKFFFGEET